MYFKVILANGYKFNTENADNPRSDTEGFLHIKVKNSNPGEIYSLFGNPETTKEIKVVKFIDNVAIHTDEFGNKTIDTTVEQDPRIRIHKDYKMFSIEKDASEEDSWFVTLVSNIPKPEIVLEIYEDDDSFAE